MTERTTETNDCPRFVAPAGQMESRMVSQAIYAVLASIGTMGAIWIFVWQALSRSQDSGSKKRLATTSSNGEGDQSK